MGGAVLETGLKRHLSIREPVDEAFDALGEPPDIPRFHDPILALDCAALSLQRLGNRLVLPLAAVCHRFVKGRGWDRLGFALQADYVRERLDRSLRWLNNLDRLHRACERWPQVGAAVTGTDGGKPIGQQQALAIARDEFDGFLVDRFIERARETTLTQLRHDVGVVRRELAALRRAEVADANAQVWRVVKERIARREASEASDERDPDAEPERVLNQIDCPAALGVAFDEAHELHQAVSGGRTSRESFVEDLLAETRAGLLMDGAELEAAERSGGAQRIERARRRSAAAREERLAEEVLDFLRRRPDVFPGSDRLRAALERTERFAAEPAAGAVPADLATTLEEFSRLESEIQRLLGLVLLQLSRYRPFSRHGHRGLPFADLGHYARERLGISATTARGLMDLARSLESYPLLEREYREGRAGRIALRHVTRLFDKAETVDEETERAWAQALRTKTVRRIEDEYFEGCRRQAEDPGRVPAPLEDHEWCDSLRREAGRSRARVRRLCRAAAGRMPSSEIRLWLRPDLSDELDAVLAAVAAAAEKPSTFADGDGSGAPVSSAREKVSTFADADGAGELVSSAREKVSTFADAYGRRTRVSRGQALGLMLEQFVETWDPVEEREVRLTDRRLAVARPDTRPAASTGSADLVSTALRSDGGAPAAHPATPSIPTAVGTNPTLPAQGNGAPAPGRRVRPPRRASIYERDGYRCSVPGCTARSRLESHHPKFISQGGAEKDPANQTTLCWHHHHNGAHGGLLHVRGRAPLDLTWRLGSAGEGTWYRNDRRLT
jgi:hypothetical protein